MSHHTPRSGWRLTAQASSPLDWSPLVLVVSARHRQHHRCRRQAAVMIRQLERTRWRRLDELGAVEHARQLGALHLRQGPTLRRCCPRGRASVGSAVPAIPTAWHRRPPRRRQAHTVVSSATAASIISSRPVPSERCRRRAGPTAPTSSRPGGQSDRSRRQRRRARSENRGRSWSLRGTRSLFCRGTSAMVGVARHNRGTRSCPPSPMYRLGDPPQPRLRQRDRVARESNLRRGS